MATLGFWVVRLQAAVFTANPASLGAIPDGGVACAPTPGAARDVTFTVSGISGAPTGIEVSMTFSPNHTWMGDISATLIAPNAASHVVFARTGATTAAGTGDSSDLAGPYVFADTAAAPPSGGWWQAATAAASTTPLAAGTYRTTNSGGLGAVNPMPPTSMNASFAGVANPNGTWTLRFTDGCSPDTGSISAATLTLTGEAGGTHVDFNGDGTTDWNTVRASAGAALWYTENTSGFSVTTWGAAATDFYTPADYDGDGKTDVAVWRPGAQAVFYVLNSSTGSATIVPWGTTGDDPRVGGDYDGDGRADFAVYRCPPFGAPAGQCYFYVLKSSGGTIIQPWGFGVTSNHFAAPGDYDGDGKADFAIQANNGSGGGVFHILNSGTGSYQQIAWGFASDFIIPGDYDGDGRSDLCVRRTVSGVRQHWIRFMTGAFQLIQWGATGDSSTPGDYDGDGRTDIAIWRPSATPGQSAFWVLRSTGGFMVKQWGTQGDFPVASWLVH